MCGLSNFFVFLVSFSFRKELKVFKMKRSSKVIPILEDDNFHEEWESIINQSTNTTTPTDINKEKKKNEDGGNETESDGSESEGDLFDQNGEGEDENEEEMRIGELGDKLNILLIQMEEIRNKYLKESEIRKKLENTNKELLLKITDLEEDNIEFQGTNNQIIK